MRTRFETPFRSTMVRLSDSTTTIGTIAGCSTGGCDVMRMGLGASADLEARGGGGGGGTEVEVASGWVGNGGVEAGDSVEDGESSSRGM